MTQSSTQLATHDDSSRRDKIVSYAKRFGITLAPGALDFIVGGAPGVLLSSVLSTILQDFDERSLSAREDERVKKVVIIGANKFMSNVSSQRRATDYSQEDAQEAIEGILAAARHENEQRKVRYFGNLLGNLGFHPELNHRTCSYLIKLAEMVSYRQLVLLEVFSVDELRKLLPNKDYRKKGNIPWDVISDMHEVKELYEIGLLGMPGDTMLGLTDVNPGKMVTNGHGRMLTILMELHDLPQTDIQDVIMVLSREV